MVENREQEFEIMVEKTSKLLKENIDIDILKVIPKKIFETLSIIYSNPEYFDFFYQFFKAISEKDRSNFTN